MSHTLSGRIITRAVTALVLALVLIGVGTATLLHVRERRALDEALMAAALAEAHPWSEERWRAEHDHALVRVRPWRGEDPVVPGELARAALADEVPRWHHLGDRRVLLLTVEPADAEDSPHEDHPHELLIASAPRVTLARSVGVFGLVYAVVAALVATATGLVLARSLHAALAPLRRAAAELDAIRGLGAEARLQTGESAEVDRLIRAANDLLDRLDAAARSQRRFTAEAAHELRTPVTVLLGELDLALRQDREAAAYREALERAARQTRRLRDLVESLLALARLDAGHAGLGREREHLSAVATAALQQERGGLAEAGCEVRLDIRDDAEIEIHVALLRAAVANLLRNAAVHAAGAPVTLRLHREGEHLLVDVIDGGPGLPEDRDVLFERFQRGDRRRPGLGLGLPLTREIVRRHGGDVHLLDSPESGVTARIVLPHTDSHEPPRFA